MSSLYYYLENAWWGLSPFMDIGTVKEAAIADNHVDIRGLHTVTMFSFLRKITSREGNRRSGESHIGSFAENSIFHQSGGTVLELVLHRISGLLALI